MLGVEVLNESLRVGYLSTTPMEMRMVLGGKVGGFIVIEVIQGKRVVEVGERVQLKVERVWDGTELEVLKDLGIGDQTWSSAARRCMISVSRAYVLHYIPCDGAHVGHLMVEGLLSRT